MNLTTCQLNLFAVQNRLKQSYELLITITERHPDGGPEIFMDLQSAQLARGRRGMLPKLLTLFCFALACALLIGSLVAPVRAKGFHHAAAALTTQATASNSFVSISKA
jgi:hypothetical protein